MKHISPDNYVKLFNIKESLFECYYELTERKKLVKDNYPNIELLYVDGQWFFNKKDLDAYNFSNAKLLKAIALVEKRAVQFVDFSKKQCRNFSKSSWEELMAVFDQFSNVWGSYIRIVDIPVYCAYHFEKKALQEMKRHEFTDKDFDILAHPLYNTYHQRRERDLIKVKLGIMAKSIFLKKWAFSQMILFQYKPVDHNYLNEQLSNIANPKQQLAHIERKHEDAVKSYSKLYKKLPKPLKEKADTLQRLLYIRDYRFEQAIRGSFLLQPFLQAVASQLRIAYHDLIFMTPDEIKRKETPNTLHYRHKKYAFVGKTILLGKEVDKIYSVFNASSDEMHVLGKGVSHGKVIGKARIILSKEDLGRIEKGDIIVCDITSPDYLHALKKVSAIVANIGGFTSHSAIVAREFGIPCVVGCGNATLVFKDNEIIEVDADKGLVKKVREHL